MPRDRLAACLAMVLACGALMAYQSDRLPIAAPEGIPQDLWARRPRTETLTAEKAALGEALFHDPMLSADGRVSCATCHDPATRYADHNGVALGIGGRTGVRNVPTLLNVVFADALLWDGRAATLEEQVWLPLLNEREMGGQSHEDILHRLRAHPGFSARFAAIYGHVTADAVADAISAFERTLLGGDSAFDRSLTPDGPPLSPSAQRGWMLFRGRAGCIQCHRWDRDHPFFTDYQFHNTGVAARHPMYASLARRAETITTPATLARIAADSGASELGRFTVTGQASDIGAFRTPPLRDVAMTSPYMHNGTFRSLSDVIAAYSDGLQGDPRRSRLLPPPLHLDQDDRQDLIAFLESLTSSGGGRDAAGH